MAHDTSWRVAPGSIVDLDAIDPDATPGAPGDKAATREETAALTVRLADLQARLWAEQRRSVLVVLQAMDAAGKDGTVKHVFTGINPAGVRVVSFKQPTATELAHDFLWRINRALPPRGEIGIFNRSQYEDVLIARVDELVPKEVWQGRYDIIRNFEHALVAEGTAIVKLFLHISRDEQKARFEKRLTDPKRNWKFSQTDLAVRAKWDDYRHAYAEALERTSTHDAPWFVVPANHKWYRDWVVSSILVDTLERLDPRYPPPEPGLDTIVVD